MLIITNAKHFQSRGAVGDEVATKGGFDGGVAQAAVSDHGEFGAV